MNSALKKMKRRAKLDAYLYTPLLVLLGGAFWAWLIASCLIGEPLTLWSK